MSKRYRISEDVYLVQFLEAVGADNIARDLSRSRASVLKRESKLRESGAWVAYREYILARQRALVLAGHVSEEFAYACGVQV